MNQKIKILFFPVLILSFSLAASPQKNHLGLMKAYIASEDIRFENGRLLIVDGENLLYVKTLHQDTIGVFYYYASMYGDCPNGHPYNADGGCTGYECPFN